MHWIDDLKKLREEGAACVLATIVHCEGSAPREAGTRMIVMQDGRTRGTIGGGVLEAAVTVQAKALFERGGTQMYEQHYPKNGCGGTVRVFLEHIAPVRRLLIFGGGHIGNALARVMAQSSFSVCVVEERAETLQRFAWPEGVECICRPLSELAAELQEEAGLYCVVAGFSAHHDAQVVRALALTPWRYLGVVGSKNKGEQLKEELRAAGASPEQLARFRSPCGLEGVGGKLPAEIAISIAAELLCL